MRDHVVQLARDPRPLLDHRLARRDVALALGELGAALAVAAPRAGRAASRRSVTTANGTLFAQRRAEPAAAAEVADDDERRPSAKRGGDQTVSP